MSLFKKKAKINLPDDLVVKVDFNQNDHDQQKLVEDQIEALAKYQESQAEEYVIGETYPIMQIGTAQRLLTMIAESMSADMAPLMVNLDFLEQLDGRHGINQEHRYGVDISVDYAFKNLTVPVLTDLFNNDNYDDWDFEAKKTIAQAIVDNCASGKDIISGDLAVVPDDEPINGEEVVIETKTPSGMLSSNDDTLNNPANKKSDHQEDNQPPKEVVNPVVKAETTKASGDHKDTPRPPQVNEQELGPSKSKPLSPASKSASSKNLEDKAQSSNQRPFNQVAQVEVLLPRFEVEEVPAVSPDDPGYVDYRMNERAKQNNQAITQVEQQINVSLAKNQFELSVQYQEAVDQKVKERDQAAPLDRKQIRQDVLKSSQKSLEQDKKLLKDKIDGIRDGKIADAQATFDRLKKSAENEADTTYKQSAAQLMVNQQKSAEKKITEVLSEAEKEHKSDLSEYRGSLFKTSETDLRAHLMALQEQAQAQGSKIMQTLLEGNAAFEAQVNGEHSNALNAATATFRAQTNWQHVSDTENEVSRLKAKNAELQTVKAKLETHVEGLKSDNQQQLTEATQLKSQLEQLVNDNKTQSERLDKLISAATGKDASAAGMSTNELLSAILLGQYRQTGVPSVSTTNPTPTSEETQKQSEKIKWGKIAIFMMVGLLFLVGVGFWINQHDQATASAQRETQAAFSRKLSAVESQATTQSKLAQSASQTSAENQSKLDATESAYKQRMKDFESGAAMAARQNSTQISSANRTATK